MIPMPIPVSHPFLLFIGTVEVLGAIGLILPGLVRIRSGPTPLAAAGLVLLTICAAVYQLAARQPESAVFALVIGLLAAFVAYGRWRIVPLGASGRGPAGQPLDGAQKTLYVERLGAPGSYAE
jgi:hypothetical protein